MWIDGRGTTVLPVAECKRLLAVAAGDGGIGRLGVATDQAPVVVPVNFSLCDDGVMVRTGPGFLSQAAAGRLVAFEVDQLDPGSGTAWSVLVRGLATLIDSPTPNQLETAPHPLVPEPGDLLLVVRPDVITGRRFECQPQS
jgi:nitroimidazol reductase NimA-like FMN-containing flavoprotein (pyridoxamine 5'-phosphate oxidase superfamily)